MNLAIAACELRLISLFKPSSVPVAKIFARGDDDVIAEIADVARKPLAVLLHESLIGADDPENLVDRLAG